MTIYEFQRAGAQQQEEHNLCKIYVQKLTWLRIYFKILRNFPTILQEKRQSDCGESGKSPHNCSFIGTV